MRSVTGLTMVGWVLVVALSAPSGATPGGGAAPGAVSPGEAPGALPVGEVPVGEASVGAVRAVPDPGPPPHEQPPRATLWRRGFDGWTAVARVVSVSASGRAWVDVDRVLWVDGVAVADAVYPALSEDWRGRVAFARGARPARDVWVVEGGAARRVTGDGESDRPVLLPSGALLWIGSVDGRARWVLDGAPLGGSAAEAPPPAFPARTRVVATGAEPWVVYDAGDAEWVLYPERAEAVRR